MAKSDLPPLGALRAFHAVAECLSFKRAAAQIHVTPTAISHQIRLLETLMNCRLCQRSAQGVVLTPEGEILHQGTRQAFAALTDAATRIRQVQHPATLTLTTTSNFLTHWLVPRLAAFTALYPQIDLRLHASTGRVDLQQEGMDVAIRYRETAETDLPCIRLADDRFVLVASPLLGVQRLEDLQQVTLLHIDNRRVPATAPDWAHWQRCYGPPQLDVQAGLHFSDEAHALQAAVAGQGVVIASRLLVQDQLARGVLVAPFSGTLPGASYWLVTAPQAEDRADVQALCHWLQQQMPA